VIKPPKQSYPAILEKLQEPPVQVTKVFDFTYGVITVKVDHFWFCDPAVNRMRRPSDVGFTAARFSKE
jgi:hypothetical protein